MKTLRRPMFRKGGSAKGTGVMSYVETPRVEAQRGYFGVGQIDEATANAFRQNEQNRINQIRSGVRFAEPKSIDVSGVRNFGFNSLRPGAGTMDTGMPLNIQQLQRQSNIPTVGSNRGIMDIIMGRKVQAPSIDVSGVGNFGFGSLNLGSQKPKTPTQEVMNIDDGLPLELEQLERQTELPVTEKEPGEKEPEEKAPGEKESTYDISSTIEDEKKLLEGLLRNKNVSRGEAALMLAEALNTKGGIGKKISKLGKLAKPAIASRRKEDKEIALTAYKIAKQKELEEIKAGRRTGTAQMVEDYTRLQSIKNRTPEQQNKLETLEGILKKETDNEKEYNQAELAKLELPDSSGNSLVSKALKKKRRLEKSQAEGKVLNVREKQDLEDANRTLELRAELRKALGYASRTLKAEGGLPDTNTEEVVEENVEVEATNVPNEGQSVPMKPVPKLSYEDLRSRLPQEITNDIVQLVANSEEALQDFAYIKSQEDVNGFNVKYGVNLILPPQTV